MTSIDKLLGTIEDRKDELYHYLTKVRMIELDEDTFEAFCTASTKLETMNLIDTTLTSKELKPEPNETEKRRWFRTKRRSFIPLFQGTMIRDEVLKYQYISEALTYAMDISPYRDWPQKGKMKQDQMRIFVHGGGIGDELIFMADQGFRDISYNEINGSEVQRYGAYRLQKRELFDCPEAPIKIECDPMGKGMYSTPLAYQDVAHHYDFILSWNVMGWIKYPIYTIMNLGRLLEQKGVLALAPLPFTYPIPDNAWMAAPGILNRFMEAMGFSGVPVIADFYPVFINRWASHTQKHYEEWLL